MTWRIKLTIFCVLAIPAFTGFPLNTIQGTLFPGAGIGWVVYGLLVHIAILCLLGKKPYQVAITIDRFGNTTAASIPSALRVAYEDGRLKEGSLVVLCAFGAGFTWGSTLLRWTAP